MPPKKDDKKGKKGESVGPKEIDPQLYVRKETDIPGPVNVSGDNRLQGKILLIDAQLPIWTDNSISGEEWSEPIPADALVAIKYPKSLGCDHIVSMVSYYGLDVAEAEDPKAKGGAKKDAKKPPPKGKGAVEEVVMVEQLVNDAGIPLPIVYRDIEGATFADYTELRPFASNVVGKAEGSDLVDEVDPLLCDAFKHIWRFGSVIAQTENSDVSNQLKENYLWRAIYPKLPSGKPCYNPSGRYVVKLFVAGKWRKVYVDDSIPVSSEGKPVIAMSGDKQEIWPLLLAKAVYAAYSACGLQLLDDNFKEDPQNIGQFLSFAINSLTGWQPSELINASALIENEPSKTIEYLRNILDARVPRINESDIIEPDETFRFNSSSETVETPIATAEDIASLPEETEAERLLKTKKRFKEEYHNRKKIRDEIVARVLAREERVNTISRQLNQAYDQSFFLLKYDSNLNRYRPATILALAFPGDALPTETQDLMKVRLMLYWRRDPMLSITPNVDDLIILGKGRVPVKEFLEPFPLASPVESVWVTIEELIKESAYFASHFTGIDTLFRAEWTRRWIPLETTPVAAEKGAKDKGKGKEKGAAPVQESEYFVETGTSQAMLLSLDTAAIKAMRKKKREDPVLNDSRESALQSQDIVEQGETIAELDEAIVEQAMELEKLKQQEEAVAAVDATNSKTEAATADDDDDLSFVKLTVTLLADRVELKPIEEGAEAQFLHNDSVLIIQEIRLDDQVPLVFVMDQRVDATSLSSKSVAFRIPVSRLPEGKPVLFWVRLFSRSSLTIVAQSDVAVKLDLAENIWLSSMNVPAFVAEGESQATVESTEQLIFRLPLLAEPTEDNGEDSSALAFLHVADGAIERCTSLILGANKGDQFESSRMLPHTQGQRVPIGNAATKYSTLLAYISPSKAAGAGQVPGFKWKLVILSPKLLSPPRKALQELPVTQRFSGLYVPNNKTCLFRDVYSIEKNTFPIAMKLSVSPLPSAGAEDPVSVRWRMLRRGDGALVAEYTGAEVLYCFYQDINEFTRGGGAEEVPAAAAAAPAGKADPKAKGAKGAPAATAETIDIIIECLIDAQYNIPAHWKSRFPHVFDALFAENEAGQGQRDIVSAQSSLLRVQPPVEPLLSWALDVMSGKVASVSHDISGLQRQFAVKKGWEDASSGRLDQALAAVAYIKERKSANASLAEQPPPPENSKLSATMTENLVTALTGEAEEISRRFGSLHQLSQVPESVQVIESEASKSLVAPYNVPAIGSEEWEKLVDDRRLSDSAAIQELIQRLSDRTETLADELRLQCKVRLEQVCERLQSQRGELISIYSTQREKYRADVERQNLSLIALLKRARDAKLATAKVEEAAEAERLKNEAKNAAKKKK